MDNKQLFDYFKALMDRQGKYHDHKEVSAWAGLVLHLLFCFAMLRVEIPKTSGYLGLVFVVVAVFAAAYVAFKYIRNQLELKDRAGSLTAAATYYMSKMVSDSEGALDEPLTPIKQSADTQMQSSHVLSQSFDEKARWLNTQGRGAQDATRRYTYGLLITVSVFVIVFKFVQVLG